MQLVGALERSLGCTLFHRTTRGLSLSADGKRYYDVARRIVADLRDVEQHLGPRRAAPRRARPQGTLAVGMRPSVGMHCVMPRISRFIAQYPDIELVIRPSFTVLDIDERNLLVPAKTPSEIVMRLNAAVRQAVQSREISEAFAKISVEPSGESPEDCARLVRNEHAMWGAAVKASGFVGED